MGIERLVSGGYTWNNMYTQCVLGNILLTFRLQKDDYDPEWCDRGGMGEDSVDAQRADKTLKLLVSTLGHEGARERGSEGAREGVNP